MDLVDEQHVAVVEIGQDGGEVTGALERGPARDAKAHSHLRRDDPRQRGLAQPGRAREEEMVNGLAAPARRGEKDLEVLLESRLTDEFVEPARPQRDFLRLLDGIGDRPQQLLSHRSIAFTR